MTDATERAEMATAIMANEAETLAGPRDTVFYGAHQISGITHEA
ncbi:MAG: hypothetical protein WBR17_01230 [Paraburkholderia sp.]